MSPQFWPPRPRPYIADEVTVVAGGASVSFPAGLFDRSPFITAQIAAAAGNLQGATLRVSSISASGCTIYLTAPGGATSALVHWHAMA